MRLGDDGSAARALSAGLEPVGSKVWRGSYAVGRDGEATMLVVDAGDGLVVVSPAGGPDAAALFDALDRLGAVRAFVAPCGHHTIGLKRCRERYPGVSVFRDERLTRIDRRVASRSLAELPLPSDVEIFVPPHLGRPDTIVRVRVEGGWIWFFNDLITNLPSMPDGLLVRTLLRLLGFRTGLAWNRFGLRFVLRADRPALSRWLHAELSTHPPVAVVFGHGPVIREPADLARFRALVAAGA
jgi:hypothetical protein